MTACCTYAATQPWPADTAAAICEAESSSNPNALGDGGRSRGLWQIDGDFWPQYDSDAMFEPAANAAAAFKVYQSGGFGQWSTFNSGAYRALLGQCSPSGIPSPAAVAGSAVASVQSVPTPSLVMVGLLLGVALVGLEMLS